MTSPTAPGRPLRPAADMTSADFEALDDTHRAIQSHLLRLAALARDPMLDAPDEALRAEAAAIEAFFSGTSRDHHAEEERRVIPPLLQSSDAKLVAAVRTLQQDHGWIEENWIELAPQLRALAEGLHWVDPAELQHMVEVYVDLVDGHIALEESLIYPESRAMWAEALAKRGMVV